MTLNCDAIRWSIDSINRHSDGDLFPFLPEVSAIASDPESLVKALANKPLAEFAPQPNRRFIVPKEGLSYRQATQLHPQDSILLTAAVYQFGQGIEQRRQPKDTVFSYRFNPVSDHGLYGPESLWNEFWTVAYKTSKSYSNVLYCDIADFYNQIYHHTVENQLAESQFPNQAIKWILNLLESTTAKVSRGIPIGPHGAHLIAECTLIPVDNSLKANGLTCLRYADDMVVFCHSDNEAKKALQTIYTTLDKQQRLMLQHHKTRIFEADAFGEYCLQMIEDRPISKEEDNILQIIKKYSGGNPYATVTYNQVSQEDWQAFQTTLLLELWPTI